MTIAYWKDEYQTGNEQIDEQHQHLFAIINNLHNAMLAGHGREMIKTTLDDLIDYTVEHFLVEQVVMIKYDYPDYQKHKQAHDELTAKVKLLAQKVEEQDVNINREVLHFLNEWLVHHIRGNDQPLIKFLKSKTNDSGTQEVSENSNQEVLARIRKSQALIQKVKNHLKSKA